MLIQLHKKSYVALHRLIDGLTACFVGFWLGWLDRDTLEQMDQNFYDSETLYRDDEYNQSGFWNWEIRAIHTYFQDGSTILLSSAGGGREVFALNAYGYEVDAFECNPNFVESANQFLQKNQIPCTVQLTPRNTCLTSEKIYDGLIVGWGGYTLIQGRQNRIAFLQQLRSHVKSGAPILLSFLYCYKGARYYRLIQAIANLIRRVRWKSKAEIGDFILPENFVHYFSQEQITAELEAAGFELVFYSTDEYGHAVGVACEDSQLSQF